MLATRVQAHYRAALRTEFIAHSDETDPELLERLRRRALEDAAWILKKYGVGDGSDVAVSR